MAAVAERLRPYLLGCKAYFRLAQTPKVWRELDVTLGPYPDAGAPEAT